MPFLRGLSSIPYNLGFFARTVRGAFSLFGRGRTARRVLVMQIFFTFVQALGIVSLLALGIGAAVNVIGVRFLTGISQERLIYPLLITIITRELGPLLAAFIVIARSATAIATETAGMVISHEVEAYISVGVDPVEYLAAPRFLGMILSMFLLNIYFSIFGLAGSFVMAQIFSPMPAGLYFDRLLEALTLPDLLISFAKSLCFGAVISTVALIQGFSVERASTELPVAGLRAVGSSYAGCILADILLSTLYYMVR